MLQLEENTIEEKDRDGVGLENTRTNLFIILLFLQKTAKDCNGENYNYNSKLFLVYGIKVDT